MLLHVSYIDLFLQFIALNIGFGDVFDDVMIEECSYEEAKLWVDEWPNVWVDWWIFDELRCYLLKGSADERADWWFFI